MSGTHDLPVFDVHLDGGVVAVTGDVDIETAPAVRDAIARALLGRSDLTTVVLDLSKVTFLDSSGLSMLVVSHHRARAHGADLVVRNPHPHVRRVLDMTGMTHIVAIDDQPPP